MLVSSTAAVLTGFSPVSLSAEPVSDDAISKVMIQQARENVADIVSGAGYTANSRHLQDLVAFFNQRLKEQGKGAYHSRILAADPAKFDSALALGIQDKDSTVALLKDMGITTADKKTIDLLADGLANVSLTELNGSAFFATNPRIVALNDKKGDACIIIPATLYAGNFANNVLERSIFVDLINHHEAWHCLDSLHKDKLNAFFKGYDDEVSRMRDDAVLNTAKGLEYLSIGLRIESFADMGAVGDMIREGHPLDIIDKVIANRASFNQVNPLHTSTPFQLALKAEITEMGVDTFKTLDTKTLTALYYGILDKHALSGNEMGIWVRYASSNGAEKLKMEARAEKDPKLKKVFDYGLNFLEPSKLTAQVSLYTPAQLDGFRKTVEDYNVGAVLLDTAYAKHKIITPKTLIHAHEELQDQMRTAMREDPYNPVYPALAGGLKKVLIDELSGLNFVEANRHYGVTPENSKELAAYVQAAQSRKPSPPKPSR